MPWKTELIFFPLLCGTSLYKSFASDDWKKISLEDISQSLWRCSSANWFHPSAKKWKHDHGRVLNFFSWDDRDLEFSENHENLDSGIKSTYESGILYHFYILMVNFRKKCGTLGKYVEFFTVFGFPSLILYWLHNTLVVLLNFKSENITTKIRYTPYITHGMHTYHISPCLQLHKLRRWTTTQSRWLQFVKMSIESYVFSVFGIFESTVHLDFSWVPVPKRDFQLLVETKFPKN